MTDVRQGVTRRPIVTRTLTLYADPSDEDVEYTEMGGAIVVWEKGHPASHRQMDPTKERVILWAVMLGINADDLILYVK